jgi:hypothetical protein
MAGTSTTVHYSQIMEPELLDIVDDAWLQDKLPDDSASRARARVCGHTVHGARAAPNDSAHARACPPTRSSCIAHRNSKHTAGIPLPPGKHAYVAEPDEQQEQQPPAKQRDKWLDLGLQQLH